MKSIQAIRDFVAKTGARVLTPGVEESLLLRFKDDPLLIEAATRAENVHVELQRRYPEVISQDEADALKTVQRGFLQFYDSTVRPFPFVSSLYH